jgi:hypothetical protein
VTLPSRPLNEPRTTMTSSWHRLVPVATEYVGFVEAYIFAHGDAVHVSGTLEGRQSRSLPAHIVFVAELLAKRRLLLSEPSLAMRPESTNRHNNAANAARGAEVSLPRFASGARDGLLDLGHCAGVDGGGVVLARVSKARKFTVCVAKLKLSLVGRALAQTQR